MRRLKGWKIGLLMGVLLVVALSFGSLSTQSKPASKDNAPLMTIIYTTPSGRFMAGQTLQYIPYEYTPMFEAVIIEK